MFGVKIVSFHDTRSDATYKELQVQKLFNVVKNPLFVNQSYAMPNGFFGMSTKGIPKSEEQRKKISESNKGISRDYAKGNTYASCNKGVPKTEEHKAKIAAGHAGIPKPKLIGNRNAVAPNGREKSIEHQNNINISLNSVETKNKMKDAWVNKPVVVCPHCDITSKNLGNMTRYHFDNCKRNTALWT